MIDGQLQLDAQWLLHRPISGPRDGHIGEQVFVEKWIELQQREGKFREVDEPEHTANLDRILRHVQLPEISERECSVAASWACYLGCNVGASVIHLGDRLKTGAGEYRRFAAAWAIHNTRSIGVNGGYRAIEIMLAPTDHLNTDPLSYGGLKRAPNLSLTDYEVVEHLWLWLGTDEGAAWLDDCKREVDRRQAAAWRVEHGFNNATNAGVITHVERS
ncbi:hypothetical protein [Paraburkholderia dipogonis]|uniref:hypothetical protein n=1 Tax=Paraburkholderia dipogonis TaxID=1211383 RepID=UPI0038B7E7C4